MGGETVSRSSSVIVAMLLVVLASVAALASADLPDLPGLSAGPIRVTPLEAPSGSFGEWLYREYRNARGEVIEATMMSGPGAGPLVAGPEGTIADDRPLGFGSTYEVFRLEGMLAVFEEIPNVGRSLVLSLGEDRTLTLESSSATREELEAAALLVARANLR